MTALLAVSLLADCLTAASPVQIPFQLDGTYAIVEVEMVDRMLTFAFDTGAGAVVLNQSTALRLGLEATGSGWVTGAAGDRRVPLLGGLTLRLAGLRIEGVTAALVELVHLEEVVGRPIDGIIGRDVLRGRLILLDHDRQVLEIHERRSFRFADWGEPCAVARAGPLEVAGQVLLLSGESIPGRFHVDSGAGSFLILSSTLVRAHALADRVGGTYPRKGRGLTGIGAPDRVGAVAGIEVCGQRFPDIEGGRARVAVPAVLSSATAGVLARNGTAGLIGNAILSRFNIVFDLERGRMFLKPNDRWRDPVRSDASGLQLIRRAEGTTLIDEVVVPSPAADAGLATGDELRSIDGVEAATVSLAALRDRLKELDRKLSLVVVRDGEANTVEIHSRALLDSAH